MLDIRPLILLTLWSAGAFLPGIPASTPAQPWRFGPASVRDGTPALLPAGRGSTRATGQENGVDPHRPAIDRDRRGTAAPGRAGGQPPTSSGSRPPSLRAAAGPLQGRVLDVRYVDQVYAQRRLECSSRRVCAWNDCGPASAAMVLHYEGMEPRDVLTNRQATLDLVCETKPSCKGTTNRDRMLATLQSHGLAAYLVDAPSMDEIQASIDLGHPVILSLTPWPDHVIVAVGYKPGEVLVVHDPYGGAFWWRRMQNLNEPFAGYPKRNGEEVEYDYSDLKPVLSYGLFTTGPAWAAGPAAYPLSSAN